MRVGLSCLDGAAQRIACASLQSGMHACPALHAKKSPYVGNRLAGNRVFVQIMLTISSIFL